MAAETRESSSTVMMAGLRMTLLSDVSVQLSTGFHRRGAALYAEFHGDGKDGEGRTDDHRGRVAPSRSRHGLTLFHGLDGHSNRFNPHSITHECRSHYLSARFRLDSRR